MEAVKTKSSRYDAIDYLRAFLMILVIIHHTILAYTPSGYGALINDYSNFMPFQYIVLFFDSFFMFAFFFVSGLFSLKSIEQKGISKYLSDRFIRLILPFVFGILFINVVGYYFSTVYYGYIELSFKSFFEYLIGSFGLLPSGPLWFLWVLFLFDCVLCLLYKIKKNWCERIRNSPKEFYTNDIRFIFVFFVIALGTYLILADFYEGGFVQILPAFVVQTSRVLIYFFFFLIGSMIGFFGVERSILKKYSMLCRRWWLLLLISIGATTIVGFAYHLVFSVIKAEWAAPIIFNLIIKPLTVLIATTATFGLLGLFNRVGQNIVWKFLSRNALGIYVVHYSVVTVYQFIFSKIAMSGLIKGVIVSAASILTSAGLAYLLGHIPFVKLTLGAKYKGTCRIALTVIVSLMLAFIIVRSIIGYKG